MLRMTSKRVRKVVDKMRLPAVVRLSRSFWEDSRNGRVYQRLNSILAQLAAMSTRCRITTLQLSNCQPREQERRRIHQIAQACPHLSFSYRSILSGDGRLACVLMQCTALAHLDLSLNSINDDRVGRLAGVLMQCRALAHLDLSSNQIGPHGAGRLAGLLLQCPVLAHLNLSSNAIGAAGAGMLAGKLAQFTAALVYLNLSNNAIGAAGAGPLQPQCCRSVPRWLTSI
jgi:Ran GTPase-activating protein (RanGAP) involved in mRNA processing and transport